jgi:uncharacterized membrane protein YedE/YeeE
MAIDWGLLEYAPALVGGALIGLASALLILGAGRVAGIAGIVVGIGVRLGNGCTSGHGVCGLSRLSLRSLVNVLVFMGAGVVTVAVLRHVAGS